MSIAFILCVDLALKRGHKNIRDQVLALDVDGAWKITINGKSEACDNIPPYGVLVEFNGWPAGILDPGGGVIAAGEAANEDTLIAALKVAGAEVPGE